MAYPASTKTLQVWVEEIDAKAAMLKASAQQQHALSLAGNLDMDSVRRFFDVLVMVNVFFTSTIGVTGLAAYVNSEKQGSVADPAAEFVTMRNAVVATLDWLRANVPQGTFVSVDYKLAFVFPTGNVTPSSALKFTAAQTATYRTALNTLIATIG